MRRLAILLFALMPGMLLADSVTLKSGRAISGEILDEWDGRILMEVKKGITMVFERKDVKKVVKDKPPAPAVKKPAVKKPTEAVSVEISSPTTPASTSVPVPSTPTASPESGRR